MLKTHPIILLVALFITATSHAQVKLWDSNNFDKVSSLPTIRESIPQLKGDPWIFQAYSELYHRQPNAWELNIQNYNNGSWNSYPQLKGLIENYQNLLRKQQVEIKTAGYNGNILVGFFKNGQQVAVNVVSPGGGNVVSAGGANVVSAGGANVVSAGGANVVSPGGANILVNKNMAAVKPGQGF